MKKNKIFKNDYLEKEDVEFLAGHIAHVNEQLEQVGQLFDDNQHHLQQIEARYSVLEAKYEKLKLRIAR